MPISFDLEFIRNKHNCEIYFETGLYDPQCQDISLYKALQCNFTKLYSIEIRKDFVDLANVLMKNDIDTNRLTLINDDSVNFSKYIIGNDDFKKKTLFFLDAHVDNSNIKNFTMFCPVINELLAIKKLERNDHVILIDDVRILNQPFPWNEYQFGDIDWIQTIKNIILSINCNYKFEYLEGHILKDVLMAYVI